MGVQFRKPDTFDAYYLADFRSLTWFAIRIGASSVDEAEDLAQEAMRTVLCHWTEIEAPFAYTRAAISRDICRVRTRAVRRRDAEVRAAAQSLHVSQAPFDQDATTVVAMLRTLPQAQREVLALATDGYEPAVIAEITGQNAATVRSNLRHGRRKLIRLMIETAGKEVDDGP
jgi:RNA polymerase sigma factor (sigma-70 family)